MAMTAVAVWWPTPRRGRWADAARSVFQACRRRSSRARLVRRSGGTDQHIDGQGGVGVGGVLERGPEVEAGGL